jgi:hypothetical protein
MLLGILWPANYVNHFLSGSLYLLVATVGIGYAVVLAISDLLARYTPVAAADGVHRPSSILSVIARNRWFWIPPLYVLTLLIVLLVTHTRGIDAAQFMYRNF